MFQQADLNPAYSYADDEATEDGPAALMAREYFDGENRAEMVAFINHILNTWKWTKPFPVKKQIETGKKIERLLKEHIPKRLNKKESQIEPWLRSNWNNFK